MVMPYRNVVSACVRPELEVKRLTRLNMMAMQAQAMMAMLQRPRWKGPRLKPRLNRMRSRMGAASAQDREAVSSQPGYWQEGYIAL